MPLLKFFSASAKDLCQVQGIAPSASISHSEIAALSSKSQLTVRTTWPLQSRDLVSFHEHYLLSLPSNETMTDHHCF